MELTKEEKAARLQWAVLNSSVEELCTIYEELGEVEMTAPALGLAAVRALVERGASFCFPSTRRIEERYGCCICENTAPHRIRSLCSSRYGATASGRTIR